MESEQLLEQRKIHQNQVFSGSKRTREPAEEVTNYQNHHEILADDLNSPDRQVIDFADVQSFGEAQDKKKPGMCPDCSSPFHSKSMSYTRTQYWRRSG